MPERPPPPPPPLPPRPVEEGSALAEWIADALEHWGPSILKLLAWGLVIALAMYAVGHIAKVADDIHRESVRASKAREKGLL